MAYNNNIPQPTDIPSASQNDLLQNFISIDTLITVDHVTFDDASGNQGKHNVVSMPNYVGGAASPVAAADEIKLFTKADSSGITQLFLLPESGDALTAERNISGATRANTGECTLPSGIKIKWGRESTAANGLLTKVFATAFTSIFTIQVSVASQSISNARAADSAIRVYEFDTASFKAVGFALDGLTNPGTRRVVGFHWMAIGA